MRIRGLVADRIYRISACVKAAAPLNVYLELRGRAATHHGKASFRLHEAAAYGSDPDIVAFGVAPETDGWTRLWAEIKLPTTLPLFTSG